MREDYRWKLQWYNFEITLFISEHKNWILFHYSSLFQEDYWMVHLYCCGKVDRQVSVCNQINPSWLENKFKTWCWGENYQLMWIKNYVRIKILLKIQTTLNFSILPISMPLVIIYRDCYIEHNFDRYTHNCSFHKDLSHDCILLI